MQDRRPEKAIPLDVATELSRHINLNLEGAAAAPRIVNSVKRFDRGGACYSGGTPRAVVECVPTSRKS